MTALLMAVGVILGLSLHPAPCWGCDGGCGCAFPGGQNRPLSKERVVLYYIDAGRLE